jgi:hypothetical protein
MIKLESKREGMRDPIHLSVLNKEGKRVYTTIHDAPKVTLPQKDNHIGFIPYPRLCPDSNAVIGTVALFTHIPFSIRINNLTMDPRDASSNSILSQEDFQSIPFENSRFMWMDPEFGDNEDERPDYDIIGLAIHEHMSEKEPSLWHHAAAEAVLKLRGIEESNPNFYDERNDLSESVRRSCRRLFKSLGMDSPSPGELKEIGKTSDSDYAEALFSVLDHLEYSKVEEMKSSFQSGELSLYDIFVAKKGGDPQLSMLPRQPRVGIEYVLSFPWWFADAAFENKLSKKEESQKKPPATMRTVAIDQFAMLHEAQPYLNIEGIGERELKNKKNETVAVIGESADVRHVKSQIFEHKIMQKKAAQLLFRHLIISTTDRQAAGTLDPWFLRFEGGFSGIAKVLGLKDKAHVAVIKEFLRLGQSLRWVSPTLGRTGMGWWTMEEPGPGGRRTTHVDVELARFLRPNYVKELQEHVESLNKNHSIPKPPDYQKDIRLVPILRNDIPLVGRGADHGKVLMLQQLIVTEMVDNSRELFRNNSIEITDERWRVLAKKSHLHENTLAVAKSTWVTGNDSAPPLLEADGKNRFILSDTHCHERDFIIDGGRIREDNAKRAKRKKTSKK